MINYTTEDDKVKTFYPPVPTPQEFTLKNVQGDITIVWLGEGGYYIKYTRKE